jgi:hypothetical protein
VKAAPKATPTPVRNAAPKAKSETGAASWARITSALLDEYYARHPDRAFERAWPESSALRLGSFGSSGTLRWREALDGALAGLARLETSRVTRLAAAQLHAFEDWLEAELLLLDALAPSTFDPCGYAQRAFRTLRAVADATWLPAEEREAKLTELLSELPAHLRDARTSLLAIAPARIELALRDLEDLEDLVSGLGWERTAPARGKGQDPRAAIEGFRNWLLEQRPSASGQAPRLDADEWMRLVRLATGTTWELGELKARCLRDLARLDLPSQPQRPARRSVPALRGLTQRVWTAAAKALWLGKQARLVRSALDAKEVVFGVERSARMRPEAARLVALGGEGLRVLLELPHASWSRDRTTTRYRGLGPEPQAALGVRHGLVGEALFARATRVARGPAALGLGNRAVREGLGLYALDWVGRVDWVENPFRGEAGLAREFERQQGTEAARILAALELHAEGLSLEQAAQGFARRTGVDEDTAMVEALAGERDPLHGIGYLGLLDLRELEERLAGLVRARRGLRLCLLLVTRHPELRPADMLAGLRAGLRFAPKKKVMRNGPLEIPGRPQQEHPRSR